ncbi:MAG: hypothetical protein IPL92_13630 [Saprospiraceae bacterium]|nr:hypothetical protein [Candidatus Opimibacter iunctus]
MKINHYSVLKTHFLLMNMNDDNSGLDENSTKPIIIKLTNPHATQEENLTLFASVWLDLIKKDNLAFYNFGLDLVKRTPFGILSPNDLHKALSVAIAHKATNIKKNNKEINWVKNFWKKSGKLLKLNISEVQFQSLSFEDFILIAATQLIYSNEILKLLNLEEAESNNISVKVFKSTLTLDEAEKIASIVENILISPKLSYVYRFSELQGYNRIDVAHALMISIAHTYKEGRKHPQFKSLFAKFTEGADTSLMHIAMRGIPDREFAALGNNYELSDLIELAGKWSLIPMPGYEGSNPLSLEEQKLFGKLKMPSSIVEFCSKVISTDSQDYWQRIYAHIGLEYPKWYWDATKTIPSSKSNQSRSGCFSVIIAMVLLSLIILL